MDIETFIRQFEAGTLPYREWTHQNHLRMALYYIFHEKDYYEALSKIRCGIMRYNAAVERYSKKLCFKSYHETRTRFWADQIRRFVNAHEGTIEEIEVQLYNSTLNKSSYILQFYTEEQLQSSRYRAEYVAFQPDGL